MAKPIVVSYKGSESRLDFVKLSRSKLYGRRRRIVQDLEGRPCRRAQLTDDGDLLLLGGMTAQGYFTASGRPVERSEMVGMNAEGEIVPKQPSTLGSVQELEGPVPPEEVLDLQVQSVYILEPQEIAPELLEALEAGKIFRCPFNYYADYHAETAFLLANKEGLFALIGSPTQSVWCEPEALPEETFEESELEEDDLDFEMF